LVSSTWLYLQPDRIAIEVALQRFRETKFVAMEYVGSDSEQTSLAALERRRLRASPVGSRFGITQAEYRRAQRIGVDCFVYAAAGRCSNGGFLKTKRRQSPGRKRELPPFNRR